jgi:hypothetical protein
MFHLFLIFRTDEDGFGETEVCLWDSLSWKERMAKRV